MIAEASTEECSPRGLLLIDLGAHFGGVENYLLHLADLLRGRFDLSALCVLPELAEGLRARGVRVIRLPIFPGVFKPLRFLTAIAVLVYLLLRGGIDVVQVNGLLESLLILPARAAGRDAVYTRHGPFELDLYSWRQPLKLLPRLVARWACRRATQVVCVSESVAETVRVLIPSERFSVIPNWVPAQTPYAAPRPTLEPAARVLCVARLERYKGVHLLLEAARNLPGIEITVVGEGGYRETLETSASDLINVRFAGFQSSMGAFYQAADIFVMPSLGPEGLPMSSLEAMSHGLPCLLSDLPVHREISDQGRGARLFRSGDAASLLEGLRALCDQAELRTAYAEQAWRIVDGRYSAKQVRSAYVRVLGGRSVFVAKAPAAASGSAQASGSVHA